MITSRQNFYRTLFTNNTVPYFVSKVDGIYPLLPHTALFINVILKLFSCWAYLSDIHFSGVTSSEHLPGLDCLVRLCFNRSKVQTEFVSDLIFDPHEHEMLFHVLDSNYSLYRHHHEVPSGLGSTWTSASDCHEIHLSPDLAKSTASAGSTLRFLLTSVPTESRPHANTKRVLPRFEKD